MLQKCINLVNSFCYICGEETQSDASCEDCLSTLLRYEGKRPE